MVVVEAVLCYCRFIWLGQSYVSVMFSLFVYYLCMHKCKTHNFNFLLFPHVSDTSSALPHLSLSGLFLLALHSATMSKGVKLHHLFPQNMNY